MGILLITLVADVVLIESTSILGPVFNMDRALPAAAVVATAWAATRRDLVQALLCALVFGLLAAVHAGGTSGITLLSMLAVVILSIPAQRVLPVNSVIGFAGWCVFMSLLADTIAVLAAFVFMPGPRLWPSLLLHSPLAALVTGVQAALVQIAFGGLEPFIERRQQKSTFSFPISS